MNPINLFGMDHTMVLKSGVASKEYIDSKFERITIHLTKALQTKVDIAGDIMTGDLDMNNNRIINIGGHQDCITRHYLDSIIEPMNRSVGLKVDIDGDSMLGDLDMNWHTVANVEFPLDSCDAANKLYVQICTALDRLDEVNVEKLCKIGSLISLILNKYDSLAQYRKNFSSSLAYAISMHTKYKNIFETFAAYIEDIRNCTVFVDLKVNIIKIIEVLPKNAFQELKEELNKENLFSAPERGIRKRFKRFLNKCTEAKGSNEPLNEQLQLLLSKNLLLIDIGFVYLIDSLLHILLVE